MWLGGMLWPHLYREGTIANTQGKPIHVPTPSDPPTSEPEEAVQPEELALVPRRRPPAPPGFTLLWADESEPLPLEGLDWPVSMSIEAQLGLTTVGSLQVTISHYPVMGKVWCQYQSQTIAQMCLVQTSLQLTLSKPSDLLDSSPQIEEL